MQTNLRLIRKSRVYSDDFKREIVSLFESGKFSVLQLARLYGISNPTIYQWIYKFSNFNEKGQRIMEMKSSSTNKLKAMEQRIRELERMIGQKQIKIDFLEKMIDIAGDDLKVDIRKNFNTPPSDGSEKTQEK
ncbi:transposase [Sphingobacterium hotanense]|uniref:transposase n=1 Tax=Sphingobacterium hotanense TaxID=649196 RepID=UPI0021A3F528|nr:transposase [Sphingobacterium hotanense]MCT1527023.1 transposase [Sphingobacterium hotanense]